MRLEQRIAIAAPPEVVWQAVADWERQSEWVALTTVTVQPSGPEIPEGSGEPGTGAPEDREGSGEPGTGAPEDRGHGVGERLTAVTRLGPIGVTDRMQVTLWEPPRRVDVVHLGRVVRGTGTFLVEPAPGGAWFTWAEELDVPFGWLGRAGAWLLRPAGQLLLRRSLRTLARRLEAGG